MPQVAASFRYHVLGSQMARAACKTSDGGVIATGDASNPNSPSVGVLIKANQWQKTFSGPYARSLRAVTELPGGELAAAGYSFHSIYAGDERFWVLKLDSQGRPIWEKELGAATDQSDANAIAATPDGGMIVAGLKITHGAAATPSTWILRLSAAGDIVWQQSVPGAVALQIAAAPDGTYVIFGNQPVPGTFNSYLWGLKIDANGKTLWSRVYDDLPVYVLIDVGAALAADGGWVVAGKMFVRKVDKNGAPVWLQRFPTGFFTAAAAQTDGNFLVAGSNNDVYHTSEAYVMCLSGDGQKVLWDNCDFAAGSGIAAVLAGPGDAPIAAGWLPVDNVNSDIVVCRFRPVEESAPQGLGTTAGDGTFLAMLNGAAAIVSKQYPGAQFYEADLNIAMAGSPWRFVFNVPAGAHGKNGTAFLYNYLGNFQLPPAFVPQPWLEDVVIPLPITRDLAEAQVLAEKAGYKAPIAAITLRWPLYPGVTEPSYIFSMPSVGLWVFVGVHTGKVTTQPFAKA